MLKNKKILIAGLANKHSIAAGIAKAMHAQGAELAFTYQSERLKKNVEKIASELNSSLLYECDVSSDKSIETMYQNLSKDWKSFDGFVHSIGYAPADQLEGNFVDVTTREGFKIAHDISSYSFTAMAKEAKPMLNDSSSLQRGASLYLNYCYGCHSLQYSRWGRVSKDLKIPEDIFFNNLVFGPTIISFLFVLLIFFSIFLNAHNIYKLHPFQNVYFNFIVEKNANKLFVIDYWGLANQRSLEKIIIDSNNKKIDIIPENKNPRSKNLENMIK